MSRRNFAAALHIKFNSAADRTSHHQRHGTQTVGSRSKEEDILSCRILGSNMTIKVSKDAQEQSIHVRLEDELLQGHGPFSAPGIAVGASESISQLNSKRSTTSDIDVGASVSLNGTEFKRTETSDGTTGKRRI